MKVLYHILAVYMTALLLLPCADIVEKDRWQSPTHSKVRDHDTSHDHDQSDKEDFCSPFCLCKCCGMVGGIVLQRSVHNLAKAETFDLSKPGAHYLSIFQSRYFGTIWQPPKTNA